MLVPMDADADAPTLLRAPLAGALGLIGNTPLLRAARLLPGRPFDLYLKLEGYNPTGSAKDRAARRIVEDALERGVLAPGGHVVESSSGNMGLGLALVCAAYELRFTCVVDPHTTPQNLALLRAYGARVEVVQQVDEATGSYLPTRLRRVRELVEREGAWWPDQYSNLAGVAAHYTGTAPEIARQLGRFPEWVAVAVGTCATLQGIARWFHDQGAPTRILGVDSVGSVVLGGTAAPRKLPGIGSAQTSRLLDAALVHQAAQVEEADSVRWCRRLAAAEGVLVGGSSGAILAAIAAHEHLFQPGDQVVALMHDRGSRYLDLIFDPEGPFHGV